MRIAKTSWSWGRMHNILSEGRKIESRRQLRNEREREKKAREIDRIWKRNKKRHARERTLTREHARTQDSILSSEGKRDSIRRM